MTIDRIEAVPLQEHLFKLHLSDGSVIRTKDYVLADLGFSREALEPHCEEIAHMWEVTHYHRSLRPRV